MELLAIIFRIVVVLAVLGAPAISIAATTIAYLPGGIGALVALGLTLLPLWLD
jgi:hypothetical protein